jgi:RHS repeat-associated protein
MNAGNSAITASVSGATISIVSNTTGSVTNYALLGSSSKDFQVTTSGPALTGGSDPTQGGLSNTYTTDAWGNRQESGTFNFLQPFSVTNQISATGYGYDSAGNLTTDGLGNSYSYDADGKLSTSNGATYTHDPFGQRVRKDYGGTATEYYYFGGSLLATKDPSTNQWTDYIYAGGRLIAESPQTAPPVYRIGDHLDSLAQKLDAAGNVLGSNDFSPYGELVSSSAPERLMFTQHERDAENYNDSALYRQYASTQGRWLSPDPYNGSYNLADPQSLNRYAYVAGRPLAVVDSLGLDGFWDSVLEFVTAGLYDHDDSKGVKQTGSSPAEEGYGVANPGNPFVFSEYVNGYGGGGGFNTNLLGVALSVIPTGGAQGAKNNPQPCVQSRANGKALDYSQPLFKGQTTQQHILSRHAPGVGKQNVSTYWTQDWSTIQKLNYWTFVFGNQSFDRGNPVIDFTFPNFRSWLTPGSGLQNGIGYDARGNDTLTNHLVLLPDCRTVVTSLPIQ